MRDFFWFAVLTFMMALVGDYQTKMKTVRVSSHEAPATAFVEESKSADFAFLLNSAAPASR